MDRYCTHQGCWRRRSCELANPSGNPAATIDCANWYVAGPDERCANYAPNGKGEPLHPLTAVAICLLVVVLVVLIGLAVGW